MGTDAERQRRHRAHKRGNHDSCSPDRCEALRGPAPVAQTAPEQRIRVTPVTRDTADGFGPRGARLWRELTAAGRPAPMQRLLIEEACRLADRCDRLDALLCGRSEGWLTFAQPDDGGPVEVVVDKALAEARQHAVALRQIVAELRMAAGGAPAAGGQEVSFRDQLAARRAQRLADTAGS